jgi:predicted ribosomally synthesized peptide with nif11-like leader
MTNALNQNVIQFRTLVDADPALQTEIAGHANDGQLDVDAIVKLGEARGFSFSAEDLVAAIEQDDELSDLELELVAAGLSPAQYG